MRASPASRSRSAASSLPPSPLRPPSARDRVASSADHSILESVDIMNQHMPLEPVSFVDVASQRARLGKVIDEAVSRVLSHCQFINGPEVAALEAALVNFSGAKHVISCASGTDALLMVLMAKG